MDASSVLYLLTFGGLGLRREPNRGHLSVPRRGLALLAMLCAAPAAGWRREMIMAYLWPESDEERARNALRQTLHTLRRDLAAPALVSGRGALRLNPDVITSDLQEFDRYRAAGDLIRAMACYGGPFLDGFHVPAAAEFDQWVDRTRAEYAARASAAFEAIARDHTRAGRLESAAEAWRRRAALDPLDTRVAMEFMTALLASGNAAAAARQAMAHEALLREELGTAPSDAFLALAKRIRAGQGTLADSSLAPESTPRPVRGREEGFRARLEHEMAGRYAFEGKAVTGRDGSVRMLPARDLRHGRPVSIRIVHPSLASTIDTRRFIREIEVTSRLQHPHILPLLESGEFEGRPWYAVPRPDGESLRVRLSRESTIPVEEAVRLTREVADALMYAHSQSVIHRDVTPENIMLTGGHALLTNFGVTWALTWAAGPRITETGTVPGTAAYMSPEQAGGLRPVDERSDVYSLAVVLFEMLTGEPLFSGPTQQAIMAKRAAVPGPSAAILGRVPAELREPIARALAVPPEDRFESPGVFASALSAHPSQAGETNKPSQPRPGWRSWLGLE